MQTQPAAAFHTKIKLFIAHLDVLKVEGHFAVFTVERPRFTFSLAVPVLLRHQD